MKNFEFFRLYANLPMAKRSIPLNFNELGTLTLNDVYRKLEFLDRTMRPFKIEENELLKAVESYLLKLSKEK